MKKLINYIFGLTVVAVLTSSRLSDGHFVGEVQFVLDKETNTMVLLKEFRYIADDKTSWIAPKGSHTDGASIPRFFWSFIGHPYDSQYLEAAVIHDIYCQIRTRPWRHVHRVFFEGCLAGGASKTKALIMYAAVYMGGPRWETEKRIYKKTANVITDDSTPEIYYNHYRMENFESIKEQIECEDLTIEQVEERIDKLTSRYKFNIANQDSSEFKIDDKGTH